MGVSITWLSSPESDVSGYEVWRADEHDGTYAKLAEVSAPTTSYSDDDGEAGQWYKVRAFNTHGVRGPFGPEVETVAPPTCRVYGHLTDLEGNVLAGAKISAKTRARRIMADGLGPIVPDEVQVESDDNGWWQMQLYPNSSLEPAGSAYVFELKGGGYEFNLEAEVPDQEEVDFKTLIG